MIKGKHVTLRPMEEGDLPEVLLVNNDPVVRGNVVGWAWPNSLYEQQRWFENSHDSSTHRWVVLDDESRVIGVTGLWDVDLHNRNALTALKLGGSNRVRGRGLGTDAIMAVMAFAFYDVGLERLYSSIIQGNEASRRAYVEHCGWSVEGVARDHVWRHGKFVDLQHVAVLRRDFEALADAGDYIALVKGGSSS